MVSYHFLRQIRGHHDDTSAVRFAFARTAPHDNLPRLLHNSFFLVSGLPNNSSVLRAAIRLVCVSLSSSCIFTCPCQRHVMSGKPSPLEPHAQTAPFLLSDFFTLICLRTQEPRHIPHYYYVGTGASSGDKNRLDILVAPQAAQNTRTPSTWPPCPIPLPYVR